MIDNEEYLKLWYGYIVDDWLSFEDNGDCDVIISSGGKKAAARTIEAACAAIKAKPNRTGKERSTDVYFMRNDGKHDTCYVWQEKGEFTYTLEIDSYAHTFGPCTTWTDVLNWVRTHLRECEDRNCHVVALNNIRIEPNFSSSLPNMSDEDMSGEFEISTVNCPDPITVTFTFQPASCEVSNTHSITNLVYKYKIGYDNSKRIEYEESTSEIGCEGGEVDFSFREATSACEGGKVNFYKYVTSITADISSVDETNCCGNITRESANITLILSPEGTIIKPSSELDCQGGNVTFEVDEIAKLTRNGNKITVTYNDVVDDSTLHIKWSDKTEDEDEIVLLPKEDGGGDEPEPECEEGTTYAYGIGRINNTLGKCDTSGDATIPYTATTVSLVNRECKTTTTTGNKTIRVTGISENRTDSAITNKEFRFRKDGVEYKVIYNQEAGPCTTPTENYFAITSRANNNVIKLIAPNANSSVTVSVSTDNGANWNTFESTTDGVVVATLNNNQTALFKGSNETMKRNRFSSTGQFDASGDILTLTNGNIRASGFLGLFSESNITSANNLVLSSLTLTTGCYQAMFRGCTGLTTAPALPATTLANECYWNMFWECTNLTSAPELSATTLAESCYQNMFRDCTSLMTAPKLPATTLANRCYFNMFNGCTSLTTAPVLSATTLADSCYYQMFSYCTRLNNITCLATNISATDCTKNWLNGVASTGTFNKAQGMCDWTRGVNGIPEEWYIPNDDCGDEPTINYFAITSHANNNVIKLVARDANSSVTISVSTDNGANWNTFESTIEGITVATLNNGQTALFKGSNETMKRNHFSSTGQFDVSGDILTLTNGNMAASGFRELFSATSVVSAEHLVLSADTLANNCYQDMFCGCTRLTTAPQLPANTLANYCYNYMFYRCTSLTTAPQLSATTLAEGCYQYMFAYCTRLTTAPELPATTLAVNCYVGMFHSCTRLTEAPELPATKMRLGCYICMFRGCTGLTTAPKLPADTLARQCYEGMFSDCTSLIDAPVLSATSLLYACYSSMFMDCTSLKNAPELPATTLTSDCYSYMFSGCTSLTATPELPATTLAERCYSHMFSGCTALTSITCLATSITATNCTQNWVSDVASTGTFYKSERMCDWSIGVDGIPEGWNVSPDDCGGDEPDYNVPFTIESEDNENVISMTAESTADIITLSASTNNGATWFEFTTSTDATQIATLNEGEKLLIKGNNKWANNNPILSTGRFKVYGRITDLVRKDDNGTYFIRLFRHLFSNSVGLTSADGLCLIKDGVTPRFAYEGMFSDCTNLTKAPALPSMNLSDNCYEYMFFGCRNLKTAPKLPATTLAKYCYHDMFRGCGFETAPSLPATSLTEGCYAGMFYSCTSLKNPPALTSKKLEKNSYGFMFYNCKALVNAPEMKATELATSACTMMFASCINLEVAPVLSSQTLADYCYEKMFSGCSKINSITCYATGDTTSVLKCTNEWLNGVASNGRFKTPRLTTWLTDSDSGIPTGWSRENLNT